MSDPSEPIAPGGVGVSGFDQSGHHYYEPDTDKLLLDQYALEYLEALRSSHVRYCLLA